MDKRAVGSKAGLEGGRGGKASETNMHRAPCVLVEHLPLAQGTAVDWEAGLPSQGWGAAVSASWLCEHKL